MRHYRTDRFMTRRHFEALAEALNDVRPAPHDLPRLGDDKPGRWEWEAVVRRIADVCASANGGFDRQRFYNACGY